MAVAVAAIQALTRCAAAAVDGAAAPDARLWLPRQGVPATQPAETVLLPCPPAADPRCHLTSPPPLQRHPLEQRSNAHGTKRGDQGCRRVAAALQPHLHLPPRRLRALPTLHNAHPRSRERQLCGGAQAADRAGAPFCGWVGGWGCAGVGGVECCSKACSSHAHPTPTPRCRDVQARASHDCRHGATLHPRRLHSPVPRPLASRTGHPAASRGVGARHRPRKLLLPSRGAAALLLLLLLPCPRWCASAGRARRLRWAPHAAPARPPAAAAPPPCLFAG